MHQLGLWETVHVPRDRRGYREEDSVATRPRGDLVGADHVEVDGSVSVGVERDPELGSAGSWWEMWMRRSDPM